MVRAEGPCAAIDGCSNGAPLIGDHSLATAGCRTWDRCACSLPGEGTKGTVHSADKNRQRSIIGLDPGGRAGAHAYTLSQFARGPPQCRRCSTPGLEVCDRRSTELSIAERQASHSSCTQAHRGDGIAPGGG